MEYIKILWITVFFLFSLCLFFIWSKVLVLFRRIAVITALLKKCKEISGEGSRPK